MKEPELVVIDVCAILWVVNLLINGLVFDYIAIYCDFGFLQLQYHDTAGALDYIFSNMSFTKAHTNASEMK